MSELQEFRREKDQFFGESHHSPLLPEQRQQFSGLSYFPENSDLRLEVEVEPFEQQDQIQIQTNTGDLRTYRRYGRFEFKVDGQPAQLTILENEDGFFLPFVDSQSGAITYGAGRYLEPTPIPGGKFEVDFNLAYNPYCAYNERWSCPITPPENRLEVPIRAGEKVFNPHD